MRLICRLRNWGIVRRMNDGTNNAIRFLCISYGVFVYSQQFNDLSLEFYVVTSPELVCLYRGKYVRNSNGHGTYTFDLTYTTMRRSDLIRDSEHEYRRCLQGNSEGNEHSRHENLESSKTTFGLNISGMVTTLEMAKDVINLHGVHWSCVSKLQDIIRLSHLITTGYRKTYCRI